MEIVGLDSAGNKLTRPVKAGDRIEVSGAADLVVRLSPSLPECLVHSPEGRVIFTVPPPGSIYPPAAFNGEKPGWSARVATGKEIQAYRNLALNPYDCRGSSNFFPHAASNSECRNEAVFAARNAIDGFAENKGHGKWPHQSWGPDKRKDLWWRVDWGRSAEVDKIVVTLRADFPHDKTWTQAVARFSDGSTEKLEFRASAEPQSFSFAKRHASWVQLESFDQEEPLGWCGLSEVEVWGRTDLP